MSMRGLPRNKVISTCHLCITIALVNIFVFGYMSIGGDLEKLVKDTDGKS